MSQSQPSLSVVLSVHNAEKTLAHQVSNLLDTLPDLVHRFEVLIVDDGSTDQTEEVAHELARDYPQLHVTRHAKRLGTDATVQTALDKTQGDVVILQEGDGVEGLRRAWALRGEEPTGAEPRDHPRETGTGGDVPRFRGNREPGWVLTRRDNASNRTPRVLRERRYAAGYTVT